MSAASRSSWWIPSRAFIEAARISARTEPRRGGEAGFRAQGAPGGIATISVRRVARERESHGREQGDENNKAFERTIMLELARLELGLVDDPPSHHRHERLRLQQVLRRSREEVAVPDHQIGELSQLQGA